MDYLVIEGFKSAAEEFGREAGIASAVDLDSIESRMNIREVLQRGDVSEAITRVNDLNPEVSVGAVATRRPRGQREDSNSFMHHSDTGIRSVRRLNQNFSLQYDHLSFLYHVLLY